MINIAISIFVVVMMNLSLFKSYEWTNLTTLDTLYHPKFDAAPINQECLSSVKGYNLKFGILISNYYTVIDSLPVNLNGDKYIDTVLVLSPRSLNPDETSCDFSFDKSPKRLLVEVIMNPNGVSAIRGIYDNIISDTGGVLSHFNGIFLAKNGFRITHEAGANYSWTYSTDLSVGGSHLTLKRISRTCSYGEKTDSLTYQYDDVDLDGINVPDTLANQCNCDVLWSKWSR